MPGAGPRLPDRSMRKQTPDHQHGAAGSGRRLGSPAPSTRPPCSRCRGSSSVPFAGLPAVTAPGGGQVAGPPASVPAPPPGLQEAGSSAPPPQRPRREQAGRWPGLLMLGATRPQAPQVLCWVRRPPSGWARGRPGRWLSLLSSCGSSQARWPQPHKKSRTTGQRLGRGLALDCWCLVTQEVPSPRNTPHFSPPPDPC